MELLKYYYSEKGSDKPVGPVTLEELRVLASEGTINGNTPVIREGADEWARYRDFHTGERTREVAEVVIDRAARVAAALQTQESRSFTLGFLIGIVRFLTLPWDIVARAARTVSEWGAVRFISIPSDRLTCGTLGNVAGPLVVLLWTFWWMGDCICMLVVGRNSFTLTLLSALGSFMSMGISFGGARGFFQELIMAAVGPMAREAFTIHDFGDRLAWAIKIAIISYFITIIWALIGEFFSAVASLIGLRLKNEGAPRSN